MIRYNNGTKDIFNAEKSNAPSYTGQDNRNGSSNNLFMEGQFDANTYYHGSKGANAGTIATTVLTSPFCGLIPAIACSNTTPEQSNLNFPSGDKIKNQEIISSRHNYRLISTHPEYFRSFRLKV